MRRGRFYVALLILLAGMGAAAIGASGVSAATPQEICADLADGKIDGNSTSAEISNATTQGYCSLVVIVTQAPCTEVAPNTPNSEQAPNGKWYTGPNPQMCGPAAPVAAQPPTVPPIESGTLPASVTKVTQVAKPTGAQPQAQPAGVAGEQSPLQTTKRSGTLPFTGAELLVFALVGGALIAAGLLLRASGRQKKTSS